VRGILAATKDNLRSQELFLWLIPVGVAAALFVLSEKMTAELIGASIALMLFVFLVNRPGTALIALVVFLPLQLMGFGLLLGLHVPAAILRPAGGLTELLALAILVAGLRQLRDTSGRLDRIDIAVLVYVGVVTVYLIVPHLFSSIAPTQWSPRILAWRSDAGYPLLFFGARHAPIPFRTKDRLVQVLIAMGGFVAVLALYQQLAPQAWSDFVLNTAHVATYEFRVLGLPPSVVAQNLGYIFNISPLRVSSIFVSPFDMGDYLVLVTAAVATRISSDRRSPLNYVILAAVLGAIFFSRSRSDGLAAVIILVLIALPTSRSPIEGRVRLIGVLLVAAVLVVPSLGGTRFVGAQGGTASSKAHITAIENGIDVIESHPLGVGLGVQPSTANRFASTAKTILNGNISENSIIQVGDELGIQALIPWLAMMTFILLALKRRASGGDDFAAILGFGLLGVVIAGLYHHVFLLLPVPWTLWAGAGLALSVYQERSSADTAERTASYLASPGVR
jgi:hypothetical protein